MKFDVREASEEEITEIVFSEYTPEDCLSRFHACTIDKNSTGEIFINESSCDYYVTINSKEHALNLIKALNKAIDLGWVK